MNSVVTTDEERRTKRLERDRINARERRKRRKLLICDLETSQTRLSKENMRLENENNLLCQKVLSLNAEVAKLRSLCDVLTQTVSSQRPSVSAPVPSSDIQLEYLINQSLSRNRLPLPQASPSINVSGLSSLPLRTSLGVNSHFS